MQIVDESNAKKRKQEEANEPASPERTSNATSTVAGDISPVLPADPAAAPPVEPQL